MSFLWRIEPRKALCVYQDAACHIESNTVLQAVRHVASLVAYALLSMLTCILGGGEAWLPRKRACPYPNSQAMEVGIIA